MLFRKENLFLIFFTILGAGAVLYFYMVDPSVPGYVIQCPLKYITGLDCPGCGSQRAAHAVLHGDISQAFIYNPLLFFALPYVSVGILFEWFSLKYRFPETRRLLFGKNAIYTVVIIIVAFFILRNV